MKLQHQSPEEDLVKKEKSPTQNGSSQYNVQDLDQEQMVTVDPVQLNTQNLHVHTDMQKGDYSSKITGVTFLEENRKIAPNANILLYFAHDYHYPVCQTTSDLNGNFTMEELPPGYYSLQAKVGNHLMCRIQSLKILPCQNVHHALFLKRYYTTEYLDTN